jgi:hypothetical protein
VRATKYLSPTEMLRPLFYAYTCSFVTYALAVPAGLLNDAELGILHFRPIYTPHDPATIVDLAYLRLNPMAQRLLRLPAQPAATFRTLHP